MNNNMTDIEKAYDQRINVQPGEFETINDSEVYTMTPEQMVSYVQSLKNDEALKRYIKRLQDKEVEELDISPRSK